ncbi:MAG TPA: molybdopterin dinucleotide binding domain-containing protein, partial [Cellvibrio sp.]
MPNRKMVIEGLQRAELVIAQDAFLDTETNRYADILLPGALWAEAEGVMINSERNITLMQEAVSPPGDAMADWEIIARVAREMGFSEGFNFNSAAEVFDEIKQSYNPKTGYDLRGVNYTRLREAPLQWPCADENSTRNPIRYLNTGINQPLKVEADGSKPLIQFATDSGKAIFHPRPHVDAAEMPSAEFPIILNTGRVQHQWHTLTKTGKIPTLNKLNPGTFVEIHPQDATELGIKNKDKVEIRSRRGYAILPAVVTDRVQPGCCFAPIHWNDVYGDNLCINAVTSDKIDAISQQPELKVAAVALKRVEVFVESMEIESAENSDSHDYEYEIPMAYAAIGKETSMTLIKTFAEKIGVVDAVAPNFSEAERTYLAGYISGLQASATLISAVPALPADAPINPAHRTWVNGLLAGMFSRVLPLGVASVGVNALAATQVKPELLLLWASQTGNAETLAEKFAQQLSAQGWAVTVKSMNDYSVEKLAAAKLAVFITSTFGDGDAPDSGGDFWSQLTSESAPALNELQFALLALGDSNYDQFCGHGKKLFARLQGLGARALVDRTDCDTDFESPAAEWFAKLSEQLAPLISATNAPAENQPLPMTSSTTVINTPAAYTKANPYAARLVVNKRLNAEGSGKDVRQFGFDLGDSGITYEAGDALGVWPKNCPEYVFELEQALNLNAAAPVVVDTHEKPLHQALIENYEICRPSLEALNFIAQRSNSSELQKILSAENKAELQDWLYGRQLVDILQEFPVHAGVDELLPLLKRLQPRLYSIASSSKAQPKRIDLTVSAVRYTRFRDSKKIRKGVASTFLADRAEGIDVP